MKKIYPGEGKRSALEAFLETNTDDVKLMALVFSGSSLMTSGASDDHKSGSL